MFEKYILTRVCNTNFEKLSTDSYLGSNFSTTNKMGSNIAFKSTNDLTIKYAITKDEYRKKQMQIQLLKTIWFNYIIGICIEMLQLYMMIVISPIYVQMKLQSNEAKIFSLY